MRKKIGYAFELWGEIPLMLRLVLCGGIGTFLIFGSPISWWLRALLLAIPVLEAYFWISFAFFALGLGHILKQE